MKSRREESFNKIEAETFYTSPPYNYRPSIVEYLTNLNVTKNGFIADIMHLDYKGNLKINSLKEDSLQISLIENKDLNLSEVFIWDYLKSIEKNNEIVLDINKIPKKILSEFSALVRIKTSQKFKPESLEINPNYDKVNINNYRRALFGGRIFVGFLFSFFSFLSLIAIIAGLVKLSKQKSDIKFFLKKFVLRYFLTCIVYYPFLLIFFSLIFFEAVIEPPIIIIALFVFLGLPLIFLFYKYSKIVYDYTSWLFESKEASENRREWIKFKSFVIKNSEIEKKPLSHYILWGPFYYYTLAVGGISKKI